MKINIENKKIFYREINNEIFNLIIIIRNNNNMKKN